MRGGFPLGLSTSVTLEDFSFHGLFPRVIDSQVPVPHFAVVTLGPESRFGVSPLLVCLLSQKCARQFGPHVAEGSHLAMELPGP